MSNTNLLKDALTVAKAEFEAARIKQEEAEMAYSRAVKMNPAQSFSGQVKSILRGHAGVDKAAVLTDC